MSYTWPVDRGCFPALPADTDPTYAAAKAAQDEAADMAAAVLWALSGRQFSLVSAVVRPDAETGRVVEVYQSEAVGAGMHVGPDTYYGHGVPTPDAVEGAMTGDFYVDLDSGVVYKMKEGV